MLKLTIMVIRAINQRPVAFRRLCVETQSTHGASQTPNQLPSGGCVLKLNEREQFANGQVQLPSGGCVLKHVSHIFDAYMKNQLPSGGCVLKLRFKRSRRDDGIPAAFRRLCVEIDDLYRTGD